MIRVILHFNFLAVVAVHKHIVNFFGKLGFKQVVDADLICPDKSKTLREGAIKISGWNLDSSSITQMYLNSLAKVYGFSLDVPVAELPEKAPHGVLNEKRRGSISSIEIPQSGQAY